MAMSSKGAVIARCDMLSSHSLCAIVYGGVMYGRE